MIFKIIFTVYLGVSAIASIYLASKGVHTAKRTPGAQAFGAVLLTLFAIGLWIWL